jgi:hypothetical protein
MEIEIEGQATALTPASAIPGQPKTLRLGASSSSRRMRMAAGPGFAALAAAQPCPDYRRFEERLAGHALSVGAQ